MSQNSNSAKSLALEYFRTWNKNDAEALEPLFADDAILEDWNNNVGGIDDVIEVNRGIFNDLKSITANVLEIDTREDIRKAFCRLSIDIEFRDGSADTIEVMDVISFNENGQIKILKAYNGTYNPE